MKIDVLDKGHVQYMDHMGTDLTVVNAARVSFDKESDWGWECLMCGDSSENEATEKCGQYDQSMCDVVDTLSERDTKLINYLAKHNHWTPFGQCNLQLRIKMPIFVARQLMRSNVGIVWNEVSRRYVDSEPEFYEPEVWRGRPDGSIKQGSGQALEYQDSIKMSQQRFLEAVSDEYGYLLDACVCPEQARMVLPQSTYTEVVGNFTLAALARVYTQRADSHAQWEIQQYALAMGEVAREQFPVSWEALTGGE